MRTKSKNRYFQPNPRKSAADNCAGDCVIRAFCAAEEIEWDEVYKELCEIGFEKKCMINTRSVTDEYLVRHGYTRHPISNKKGSTRPTVDDMATRSKKDGIAFVCEVANHTVTCKDGFILDTWDCGYKSLYAYWTKEA